MRCSLVRGSSFSFLPCHIVSGRGARRIPGLERRRKPARLTEMLSSLAGGRAEKVESLNIRIELLSVSLTILSLDGLLFELDRAEIAQGRMPPPDAAR
jgi:hypothetical protein